MASRLFQQKVLKADDLKPKLSKAVNNLRSSRSYMTAATVEALKTIREASNHQHLQLALGDHLTESGYASLLVNIYKSLKEIGKTDTKAAEQAASSIITILTSLSQFTAESVQLCTALQNEGTLSFFIDQLHIISLPFDELDQNSKCEVPLILEILYHCIRHCGELRTLYRKHDVVPLLSKFLNTEEVMVKTTSLVTLAYTVDETESDKLATTGTDGCVNFLIFRLKAALHSRIHRAGGFTAAGLLEGLIHLMASDANKVKVLEQGALPLILRMLKRADKKPFSEEEQVLAATAIWKFAFIDSNRKALKADPNVLDALNDFKTSKNAKLRDACCGALWEIYEGEMKIEDKDQKHLATNEIPTGSPSGASRNRAILKDDEDREWGDKSKGKNKKRAFLGQREEQSGNIATLSHPEEPQSHIMISYQWDSQKLMIRVKDALQKEGYNVWMDVEKMGRYSEIFKQ
ncbi:uncharacterized protein [Amphiura filiformis]|uniref:uncharacterized protein n=1 Tax=Amphiura filiformis TaxID=82378 RepID=UPI003B217B02